MIRAQADEYAGLFRAKGYPVRVGWVGGSARYVVRVNTADDRPAVELATMHEAQKVLDGLKDRTKEKAR